MFRIALPRFAFGLTLVLLMSMLLFVALRAGAHGSQICLATTAGCNRPTPITDDRAPTPPYAP